MYKTTPGGILIGYLPIMDLTYCGGGLVYTPHHWRGRVFLYRLPVITVASAQLAIRILKLVLRPLQMECNTLECKAQPYQNPISWVCGRTAPAVAHM